MLLENFFKTLNEPLDLLAQRLQNEESILLKQIDKFSVNDENRGELSINIHKKIKEMNHFSSKIKGLY